MKEGGRYLDKIGEGSFGVVTLYQEPHSQKTYVIKEASTELTCV